MNPKLKKTLNVIELVASFIVIALMVFLLFSSRGRTAAHKLLTADPELQRTRSAVLWPIRGNILDCEGRVVASNWTEWDIHLDCTVAKMTDDEWKDEARELSKVLAEALGERPAYSYYDRLVDGREQRKQYLEICRGVQEDLVVELKRAPLLCGEQFETGVIVESHPVRVYPFGELARRTIGRDGGYRSIGIEAAYDEVLRGEAGQV